MSKHILKDGRTLYIRNAMKKDAPELVGYMYRIGGESDFLTFGSGELNIPLEQEEAFIDVSLRCENRLFIVGIVDNKIAANLTYTGGYRKRTYHTGEFGITVLKDYWGLGIGELLMKHMIDWAKNTGFIRKINLKARSDNYRAISLYTKMGFIKEGLITRDFCLEGKFYDSVLMGLNIDKKI